MKPILFFFIGFFFFSCDATDGLLPDTEGEQEVVECVIGLKTYTFIEESVAYYATTYYQNEKKVLVGRLASNHQIVHDSVIYIFKKDTLMYFSPAGEIIWGRLDTASELWVGEVTYAFDMVVFIKGIMVGGRFAFDDSLTIGNNKLTFQAGSLLHFYQHGSSISYYSVRGIHDDYSNSYARDEDAWEGNSWQVHTATLSGEQQVTIANNVYTLKGSIFFYGENSVRRSTLAEGVDLVIGGTTYRFKDNFEISFHRSGAILNGALNDPIPTSHPSDVRVSYDSFYNSNDELLPVPSNDN